MICEFRNRIFLYFAAMLLLCLPAEAQNNIVFATEGEQVPDSLFLTKSHQVIFQVNRTEISPASKREMLTRTLIPEIRRMGGFGTIIGRAAASPEGQFRTNKRLAEGRLQALVTFLEEHGIDASHIKFDVLVEDYPLLVEMMRQAVDADYEAVREIVEKGNGDFEAIKIKLMNYRGGKLWSRLKQQYFPDLRAVRFILLWEAPAIDWHYPARPVFGHVAPLQRPIIIQQTRIERDTIPMIDLLDIQKRDSLSRLQINDSLVWPIIPVLTQPEEDEPRREFLSLKTNLPMWGAVIPQYGGWCPLPNVSVEYYPAHGHFTYGFSYDNPWWIGNTTNHKYFEVRHYQAEARYYFRDSDKAYEEGGAAFKKWFLSGYADAGLYQVGFSATKGWIGEGAGAGLGGGYVLPLSRRNQHWRLELSAQFGVFVTKYDPFVYGCPIDGVDDGLYYYNWTGKKELFRKRMHRFTWFGPTRIGITLSYDLLYRKNHKKGVSFRPKEQKGDKR